MLGCNRLCILAAAAAAIGISTGISWGAMTGFWVFSVLVVTISFTYAGMNYSNTIEALGSTPKKVGMLVVLLLITVALVPIYSSAFGAPQSGAIALAAITTLSIGWVHGTLEPSGY